MASCENDYVPATSRVGIGIIYLNKIRDKTFFIVKNWK